MILRTLAFLLLSFALQAQDYTLTARVNPQNVFAGHPLTIEIDVAFLAPPYNHVFPTLQASSPTLAVSVWCGIYNPACWGAPPFVWNNAAVARFFVLATPAAAGAYTVTLTTVANAITHTITLPVTGLAVPTGIPAPPAPPLDPAALKRYEAAIAYTVSPNPSVARCDPAAATQPTWQYGVEGQAWYYDGAYGYFQLADYFHDAKWMACAFSISSSYQAYVMTTAVPGWRVFTHGLKRAFEETGNEDYKNAVARLATASPYALTGGDAADNLVRETSYILDAYTDAHLMGLPTDPKAVARARNYLLGDAETLFSGPPETTSALDHQTFMDGLLFESLSYYYDNRDKDPRIPPAVKKGLDWIWTYAWDDTKGQMLWNPFATNPGYPHHCDAGCGVYQTLLAGLVQPGFWWYWRLSRDDRYRVEGEAIFGHLTDEPTWSGKALQQLIKWSVYGLTHYRNGE